MIEHFFGAAREQRRTLAVPLFALGISRIDLAEIKADLFAQCAAEVVKKSILDRFADHARAEQADADCTRFVH